MKITADSHVDHVSAAILAHVTERFAGRDAFFIESFDLPEGVGTLECGLYGPVMGDVPVTEAEATYTLRPGRKCATRGLKGAMMRPTRTITVIAGPDNQGNPCVLYTVYGGPVAPREPGDPTIPNWEGIEESRKFWAEHALAFK